MVGFYCFLALFKPSVMPKSSDFIFKHLDYDFRSDICSEMPLKNLLMLHFILSETP